MVRRGSRPRRWCVPPAILRGPDETLEGGAILTELPGDLGVLLWRTLRDVRLWGETPPEARANLFADESGDRRVAFLAVTDVPTAISAQIDTINGMLTAPGRADGDVLTVCCLEVAGWARRAGLAHTAIDFAQAGALACPELAEPALQTGIAASASGQDARAGTWLRRAVTLARREKNRAAYLCGLLELARIYERQGDADAAEQHYRWAYRSSRRGKAGRAARMRAAHGLLRVTRPHDTRKATQFAAAALRAYRPQYQGGPQLLVDLAGFWIELGEDGRAAAVLTLLSQSRAVLPPADQLASAALTARVLAAQDEQRRADAERDAWALIADETIPQDVRCRAAVDLAHAARTTGDLAAFTRAKREAMRLAPQDAFPRVSAEVSALWPEGQHRSALDRAS